MNTIRIQSFVFCLSILPFVVHSSENSIPAASGQYGSQIWQSHNARLFLSETGLKVLAELESPRPVLTIGHVSQTGEFTAKIQLKVTNPGTVGIKWIKDKGEESERPMSVYKKVKARDGYQEVAITVPVKGHATDFQLLTPWGDSTIRQIRFVGANTVQEWTFVPDRNDPEKD